MIYRITVDIQLNDGHPSNWFWESIDNNLQDGESIIMINYEEIEDTSENN